MKRRVEQNTSLPVDLRDRLRNEAARRDVAISLIVQEALRNYFKKGNDKTEEQNED